MSVEILQPGLEVPTAHIVALGADWWNTEGCPAAHGKPRRHKARDEGSRKVEKPLPRSLATIYITMATTQHSATVQFTGTTASCGGESTK